MNKFLPSKSFLASVNMRGGIIQRRAFSVSPTARFQKPRTSDDTRRYLSTSLGGGSKKNNPGGILPLLRKTDSKISNRLPIYIGSLALACGLGQLYYGDEKDFYDYRFICDKDPDDLADFYGSENFMDIYCVLPFMGTLMMRGGYFDEDGVVHTTGLPGEMLVSMVFSDSEEEDDETDEDEPEGSVGRNDMVGSNGRPPILPSNTTGRWFNKRERFHDVFLGYTMWDMVTNFGFETLPDGRTMVYHHGEYFRGNIPPVSLLVRLVFGVHARWVAWATEHHINHYAFQNDTDFDEQLEHESRVDMPLFLIKNYAWSDLMAVLFGRKVEKPSFLVKKSTDAADKAKVEEEEEYSERIEEAALSEEHELPFQRTKTMRRITMHINLDKTNSNVALGDYDDDKEEEGKLRENLPARLPSTNKNLHRRISTEVALNRYHTSLNRTLTKTKIPEEGLQRQETLNRENIGGNVAWEALRSTNNPKAYKAASIAARSRYTQRRASSLQRRASLQNLQLEDPKKKC